MEKESEPKGYQIIISELQKMLANGELKCGDKLPSERNMTTLFHLSRTSVREASGNGNDRDCRETPWGGKLYCK